MRLPSGGIGPLALIFLLIAGLLYWLGLLPGPIFDLVFVLSLAISLLGSLPRFGFSAGKARLAALGFGSLGAGILALFPGAAVVPFLAIALAYAQMTYVFAHGLMPGRQPILEQLIRLMAIMPDGASEFWRFVRGQCQLWTIIGCAMVGCAIVATLFPVLRESAARALTIGVAIQLGVFVLSHIYAKWRYQRPETWVATLKAMFRPAIWSKLDL